MGDYLQAEPVPKTIGGFTELCRQLLNFQPKDFDRTDPVRTERIGSQTEQIKRVYQDKHFAISAITSGLIEQGLADNDIAYILKLIEPTYDAGRIQGIIEIARGG